VVTNREGIVYKRLLKSNRSKGKITMVSDNPQFEPYAVAMEDVIELWQSDAVISKTGQQSRLSVNHLADMVSHLQDQVSLLKKKIKD